MTCKGRESVSLRCLVLLMDFGLAVPTSLAVLHFSNRPQAATPYPKKWIIGVGWQRRAVGYCLWGCVT